MINHKICFIKLLCFIVKIQIIFCGAERFIHLGNVIVSIMETLPIEQNLLTKDEKISDDLLIMIQNKNAESNQMHNIFTHDLLKKWFSITNCQFEFLYTQRDVSKENLSLDQEDFYFLLKNLYVDKKIYKINNLRDMNFFLQKNRYSINIIHNKKSIQPETVKDLFLNFTKFYFLNPFYDLTIIILEGIEKNKEDFIGYFLKQYNKRYDLKHDYLNCKLFFDQKQHSIANSYKKKDLYKIISVKKAKIYHEDCNFYGKEDLFRYYKTGFLYSITIFHRAFPYYRKNYEIHFSEKIIKMFSIKINFFEGNIINLSILTQTKREKSYEKNNFEIVFKETIFIEFNGEKNSYNLAKFSYFIKMKRIPRNYDTEKANENPKDIKFNKPCEQKFFNEKIFNLNNFMPLCNFLENHINLKINGIDKVYYNNLASNCNISDYDELKNIVILDVLDIKDEEINNGQKNINAFFLRLKEIFKYNNSNSNHIRFNENVLNINFKIFFEEKTFDEIFKTNISINDNNALNKIRLHLEKNFDDADISNVIYYNFKPFVYSQNFRFDPNINLDFIDKQNYCNKCDLEKKRIQEIFATKIKKQESFLRFYYTLKTRIKNQKFRFNAQFYYYDHQYNKFCEWIKDLKIKNFICEFCDIDVFVLDNHQIGFTDINCESDDIFDTSFDDYQFSCTDILCDLYDKRVLVLDDNQTINTDNICEFYNYIKLNTNNYLIQFSIFEILNNIQYDLLFGLMHNQRNRLNIIKGIIYHHFISKNTFIKNLVKSSFFNCPLYIKKLKDFERALFVCNPVAIKMLVEKLIINLKSLEKKSNADIQTPVQKDNFIIGEKNIVQFFNKFNGDLLIMIANLEDILFFLQKNLRNFSYIKKKICFIAF